MHHTSPLCRYLMELRVHVLLKQMFKMNPAAKEFVPAHILKKRQEEAENLGELTKQLDKVDIKSDDKEGLENGESSRDKSSESSKGIQENYSRTQNSSSENARPESSKMNSTSPSNQQNNHLTREVQKNGQHMNYNNHNEADYPEGLQDLIDEEDDRFLLNAGENLCEFNGEQFIIPGDDEYEPPIRAGYDFGNAEDNEDEDVCNAFEKFLEDLPGE